jgi:tryptophanyl-tRNA synthetase
MSKSYNNALFLTDTPEEIDGKIRVMMTDPARKRRSDPGNPEVCPVFDFHKIYSPQETIALVDRECRTRHRLHRLQENDEHEFITGDGADSGEASGT